MSVVYKYELQSGENQLGLPSDSVPLSVGQQNEVVVMWVLHERDPEMVRNYVRIFHVVNTGAEFNIGYSNFIGTVQIPRAGIEVVKHVFEQLDVS